MKKTFLLVVSVFLLIAAKAQYTFFVTGYDRVDKVTGEVLGSETYRMIYNISFKDNLFIHNVLKDDSDEMDDSQIYSIENIRKIGSNTFQFTTKSGLTGNTYEYRLKVNETGESTMMYITSDDEYDLRYRGTLSTLKTLNQDED